MASAKPVFMFWIFFLTFSIIPFIVLANELALGTLSSITMVLGIAKFSVLTFPFYIQMLYLKPRVYVLPMVGNYNV